MKTLCIIPCGNKKIWDITPDAGPTTAENIYVGGFSKKCKQYAMKFYHTSWCILSAKYGFVWPSDIVPESYNVSFNKKATMPISIQQLQVQAKAKQLDLFDAVVVLGGKNYVGMARQVFHDKDIITPLADCKGVGYMMGKLEQMIANNTSI